jgi:hypothetical protein
MCCSAFEICFQIHLAPLRLGSDVKAIVHNDGYLNMTPLGRAPLFAPNVPGTQLQSASHMCFCFTTYAPTSPLRFGIIHVSLVMSPNAAPKGDISQLDVGKTHACFQRMPGIHVT